MKNLPTKLEQQLAPSLPAEEEKPKTTLRLSPDLVKQFKYLALDKDTPVKALVEEAMKQYLKNVKKK